MYCPRFDEESIYESYESQQGVREWRKTYHNKGRSYVEPEDQGNGEEEEEESSSTSSDNDDEDEMEEQSAVHS